MDDEICARPASVLCRSLAEGEVSSRELLEAYLDRYERFNDDINAIVATDVDAAMARARACDEARAGGRLLGPLHGLPMSIKDALEVVGMPLASGAPELAGHMPTANAVAVQRLVDAGAVIFAKTNVPYMAAGFDTFNAVYGRTRNPWDRDRSPGGSSGGPAAAVSTAMSGLDIGSDIGGSVRTPAAYCGVFGHKPSYGLVPLRGHVPGPPGTLATTDMVVVGPIGRAASDLTLGLDVLAGPDVLDGPGRDFDLPASRHDELEDFRVAAWLDHPAAPLGSELREQLDRAVGALADGGVAVEEARPDFDPDAAFAAFVEMVATVVLAGVPDDLYEQMRDEAANLAGDDTDVVADWTRGAVLTHRDWLELDELRAHVRWAWRSFFSRYDVVLCPTMPTAAFPHVEGDFTELSVDIDGDAYPYLGQLFWPSQANFAMLPATAVPVGLTASGLPAGLQIMADHLDDRTALRFAELTEPIWGGYRPPPDYR